MKTKRMKKGRQTDELKGQTKINKRKWANDEKPKRNTGGNNNKSSREKEWKFEREMMQQKEKEIKLTPKGQKSCCLFSHASL